MPFREIDPIAEAEYMVLIDWQLALARLHPCLVAALRSTYYAEPAEVAEQISRIAMAEARAEYAATYGREAPEIHPHPLPEDYIERLAANARTKTKRGRKADEEFERTILLLREWAEWKVAALRSSHGWSDADFCRQKGIEPSTLTRAKRRFEDRTGSKFVLPEKTTN